MKYSPQNDPNGLSKIMAIILLLSMVLLGVFPLDVILPSFPALAGHFGTSTSDIALSISLFVVCVAVSQILLGPLSDSLGRKPLLMGGIALAIIGALGCIHATEYWAFLLFRVMQALGCGCFVLANALVQDIFSGAQRDRVRILVITASGVFISTSPLAGTWLQAMFDWPGSFYVFCAVAALILIQAALSLKPLAPEARRQTDFIQSYRKIAASPAFLGYSIIAAIAFACHFSFIVVSPIIFLDLLQLSQLQFSMVLFGYGAAYIAGGLLASALNSRLGYERQMLGGVALTALAGALLLGMNACMELGVWAILLPMILCTTGTTLSRPAATGCAMDKFPSNAGAASSMLNSVVFLLGGAISAVLSLASANPGMSLGLGFVLLSAIATFIALATFKSERKHLGSDAEVHQHAHRIGD